MDKDVVLIPGALASPKLWHNQVEAFKQEWRIHHVDVLNSQTIETMAQRFAVSAPKQFTLIGFSMGGYVALELLKLIPENVERLILINSAAKIVSEKGRLERERSLELLNKGKFDFLVKLIFKNSFFEKSKHTNLLPLAQEMALEVGACNYKLQLDAILNKPDHSPILSEIACPTLLLASRDDNVMPFERSEHMASHIKNSELVPLEECGHLAMLEQPQRVNQILKEWL